MKQANPAGGTGTEGRGARCCPGRLWIVALLTMLLTACGGGGGGGGPDNQAPIADAGLSRTAIAGEFVLLDGSGSRDPDGTIVRWRWLQSSGPTVLLDSPDSVQAGFIAPAVSQTTELRFTLTVEDDRGATDSSSVGITVEQAPATFGISGTVTASASQAVDGDTNDPGRPAFPNDTTATAQVIPNPITLGGYVNEPGTGAPGRSQVSGDTEDFYRVDLLAGQTVTMLVADFREADADLYLWDDTGTRIVASSTDVGEIESLTIAEDGTYLVNASIFFGATNYLLAIGAGSDAATAGPDRADIVPWEVVLKYREGEASAKQPVDRVAAIARRMAMEQRAGGPGRARLMSLRSSGLNAQERHGRLGAAAGKGALIKDPVHKARWETLLAIKSMRRDPAVEYAEPNYRLRTSLIPDDENFFLQWHYPLIDLPAAWDTTSGRSDVVVAVVDTGILAGHPDLVGQLVPGYDFVRDPTSAGDGDGIDPDPEDPGNPLEPTSSTYHGTHVGGTVAAAGNNGRGVVGVAWSSRIMPLRALGTGGSGTSYDVNQAIRYAAGLPNDSGTVPDRPAAIINLSLGGGGFSQADQALLQQVRAAGVLVVAAAGNEASTLPAYPASYEGVISVSAVDLQQRITRYSNTGAFVDVAAPGGDNGVDLNGDGYADGVLSTSGSGTGAARGFAYSFISGTSMATPHVSGVLALMKSVNPALTPDDIDALLARGALTDDLGATGRDNQYGHGLINAQRAVLAAIEAAGGSPANDPRLVASASTLSFAISSSGLELELRNGGQGELALLSLEASAPWLQVTPQDIDAAGLGLYRVRVDRDGLAAGVYSATISARSTVNDLVVRVLLSVGSEADTADVGLVYILLYDVNLDETVGQLVASSDGGEYRFAFGGVPAGQYQLIAGTDADNDLFICDAGEACGAWLTIDQPILVDLDGDLSDLDFPIEYLISIPNVSDYAAGTATSTPGRSVPRVRRHAAIQVSPQDD